MKEKTMQSMSRFGYICLFLTAFVMILGVASSLRACPNPSPNAFNEIVTGSVMAAVDGNGYRFDVTLDDPYRFGAFYIFLNPETLAGLSLEDIQAPDGWEHYGVSEKKGYVGFERQNMSERNIVQSEDGFKIRIDDLSAVQGYGFHVKDLSSDTTYFATLVPEPGTLLLFSSGLLLLFRKRRKI
jgi:hypothetical protein